MKSCNRCHKFSNDFLWNDKQHKCCHPCVDSRREYQTKNWPQTMVKKSKQSDRDSKNKNRNSWEEANYITQRFLLTLWQDQEGYCFYSHGEKPLKMQLEKRQLPDGCTVERLNNNLCHYKDNCVLCCFECNVKKRGMFKFPFLLC